MADLTREIDRRRHTPRAIQHLRPALYIASIFALFLSIAMVIPALVDAGDGRPTWSVFAVSAGGVSCVALLGIVSLREPIPAFTPRFGFLLTTVIWLVSVTCAAVPFWLSPLRITTAGAFFEAMSGLTTTGATVLSELDSMPRSFLLWRSMLQWFGGIGIIAIGLFLFPFLRIGGMQIFRTENSDRSDKALPRIASVTRALAFIYLAITITCAIVYAALGMDFFDAVNHAMTTVATGGFSTHDRSFGFFEDSRLLWAAVVFMLLGALPFVLYVEFLVRGRLTLWRDWQVRTYFAGLVVTILALTFWLETSRNIDFETALTQATFNVVSVVTTTGYSSDDYAVWGQFAFGVFFILTFIGGCSGSTTGGIKVYRFIIVFQALRRAFARLVYPNAVKPLRFPAEEDHRAVTSTTRRSFFFIRLFPDLRLHILAPVRWRSGFHHGVDGGRRRRLTKPVGAGPRGDPFGAGRPTFAHARPSSSCGSLLLRHASSARLEDLTGC